MTYVRADPNDPPMVQVLVDGVWHHGHVIAQELVDGAWQAHVQYRTPRGSSTLGTFTGDDIRPDDTDHSKGRTVGGPA
ncbi:hypothetical protein NPS01_25710 [Nocardioides psychrotolerans]|uniref:Uncharacterized protein n=1 Tax=Nocardioides psychrotolerans TaxID=1005945 RepID=A0A1I3LSH7_9ACTN|nr:hypothetical protein [Nocardioides psychrotolerans]GEP38908.1 hypothetical protein NPS01_25710 [Nocardioides psychrotolerans]SFI87734.1 hypothetical protein SAMN05216561_11476 [Nocardioides psychrotolerans]